ncbi:hypothetical protein EDD37DRAFT_626393 [Exophiala viscosa]|uniref:Uncharacterized protein n=1 Tax=Exophiala viscosa TaxID=2486360 RepID=A0AAN6ID30_9EURO|nr:hypothetical protein EDD36DRAFT_438322 [Exophiala viscosa]KAI1626113.1 hypothetical protein EDD37DRAFT_626393 [Exophiala viscosa]
MSCTATQAKSASRGVPVGPRMMNRIVTVAGLSNATQRPISNEEYKFSCSTTVCRLSLALHHAHSSDKKSHSFQKLTMLKKASVLTLAGASAALATATSSAAGASVTIVGGTYSGQAITGYHVGAAQSYQVALAAGGSGASASEIYFNDTSNIYMDNSIYSGQALPCYVIEESSIAGGTGGPLECGANSDSSYPTTGAIQDDGTLIITGVQSWWVCDVNATQPYGVINGTVVGGFSTSEPSGSGIANCETITGLKLAGYTSSTSSASSSTSTASSASSSASSASATSTASVSSVSSATASTSVGSWNDWGSSSSSASSVSTTSSASSVSSVTSTATGWGSTSTSMSATSSKTSTTSAWVASYTGGAVANGVSGLGLMIAAGGVALMI